MRMKNKERQNRTLFDWDRIMMMISYSWRLNNSKKKNEYFLGEFWAYDRRKKVREQERGREKKWGKEEEPSHFELDSRKKWSFRLFSFLQKILPKVMDVVFSLLHVSKALFPFLNPPVPFFLVNLYFCSFFHWITSQMIEKRGKLEWYKKSFPSFWGVKEWIHNYTSYDFPSFGDSLILLWEWTSQETRKDG